MILHILLTSHAPFAPYVTRCRESGPWTTLHCAELADPAMFFQYGWEGVAICVGCCWEVARG